MASRTTFWPAHREQVGEARRAGSRPARRLGQPLVLPEHHPAQQRRLLGRQPAARAPPPPAAARRSSAPATPPRRAPVGPQPVDLQRACAPRRAWNASYLPSGATRPASATTGRPRATRGADARDGPPGAGPPARRPADAAAPTAGRRSRRRPPASRPDGRARRVGAVLADAARGRSPLPPTAGRSSRQASRRRGRRGARRPAPRRAERGAGREQRDRRRRPAARRGQRGGGGQPSPAARRAGRRREAGGEREAGRRGARCPRAAGLRERRLRTRLDGARRAHTRTCSRSAASRFSPMPGTWPSSSIEPKPPCSSRYVRISAPSPGRRRRARRAARRSRC